MEAVTEAAPRGTGCGRTNNTTRLRGRFGGGAARLRCVESSSTTPIQTTAAAAEALRRSGKRVFALDVVVLVDDLEGSSLLAKEGRLSCPWRRRFAVEEMHDQVFS